MSALAEYFALETPDRAAFTSALNSRAAEGWMVRDAGFSPRPGAASGAWWAIMVRSVPTEGGLMWSDDAPLLSR
jgi:hypothetical protein